MGRVSDAKEKLIESAIKLIGHRSYSSVGVQDICSGAGVKKGSFYYFFTSKKDLTIQCLDTVWEYYRVNFVEPVMNMDGTLEQKLATLLEKSYEEHEKSINSNGCITGCPFGNLALEMSTQDEDIRAKIQEIFNEWIGCFEVLIEKAVENGEFPPNTDIRATAQSIIAYMEGISLMSKAFNDPGILKSLGCTTNRICVCNEKN